MEEIETVTKIESDNLMNTSKKVSIDGTANRYQIRKLVETKQIHTRKILEKVDLTKYTHEIQCHILSRLQTDPLGINEDKLLFIKELKNKLTNYKQQDLLKKVFTEKQFITLDYVIDLLDNSKLKCHYCFQNVYILYELVREQMQWTLDRIDNDEGHNTNNVLISCLRCNLKRRRTSKDAFMFTKNLNIIKNHETN